MSAILGIFNFDQRPESDPAIRGMLSAMRARGEERVEVWREGGVVLAVARYEWEAERGFSGPALVVEEDECVVVADASLYYGDELRRRLAAAGVPVVGTTPSELILAAYRAWGERCAREIQGDFAFILWDRRLQRVLCARDHSGVRPLFYADLGETLIVASTIGGVVAHPRCPTDLDLASVALDAAGIGFAYANTTCYRAVRAHPAGTTTLRPRSGEMQRDAWWDPEVSGSLRPFDAAAEELRALLGDAAEQRLHPADPTALWLSGGWDSSSVFAVAQQRLGPRGASLRPVSMSYPPGDSGREDEMIQAIADHWNAPVHWVDGAAAPPIEISPAYAQQRDEPIPFWFEKWMRYLAQATRSTGARAVLTGHGGNFLFASSTVFLADLLARGRWGTLRREWRALRVRRGTRARFFFKWVVQPLLPHPVLAGLERARNRPLLGTYERPLANWLAPEFVARNGLVERAREATPRARAGSRSGHELYWFVTHPYFQRVNALSFGATLAEGIEQRAPIFDPRVIRFAAAGPWSERYSGAGTKRLLRHAMRGLLPNSVLADRFGRRDGTLASYAERSLRTILPSLPALFERPILAELGIVDAAALRRDLDRYLRWPGQQYLEEQLLSVAHVESWFRAREGVATPAPLTSAALYPREITNGGPAFMADLASGNSRQPSIRR